MSSEYPAPWVVDDNREPNEGVIVVYAADGRPIFFGADMESAEWCDIAAARLAAAAPDLLAALERLMSSQRGLNLEEWKASTAQARAAIKRARGEEAER